MNTDTTRADSASTGRDAGWRDSDAPSPAAVALDAGDDDGVVDEGNW